MPTPSEQKALAFIASIALLGGAVRVVRANSTHEPSLPQQQAVVRHAQAAESASKAHPAKRGRARKSSSRDTVPQVIGGVASVPSNFARPGDPASHRPFGYPPPSLRIDVGAAPGAPAVSAVKSGSSPGSPAQKVDINTATAAEIEKLPRIGPALAARIVAHRDSAGPYSNAEALRRVKGIGAATLRVLEPFLTFNRQ